MATNYAMARVEKIKLNDNEKLEKTISHNLRLGNYGSNIDPQKIHLNQILIGADNIEGFNTDWKNRLDELQENNKDKNGRKTNFRSDAVGLLEVALLASPAFFEGLKKADFEAWVQTQKDFIIAEYGAKNVISLVLHLDEKTPHLHALVVPEYANKLNAKWRVGNQTQLSMLQSRYAKANYKYGLKRGRQRILPNENGEKDKTVRHKNSTKFRLENEAILKTAKAQGLDTSDSYSIVEKAINSDKNEQDLKSLREFILKDPERTKDLQRHLAKEKLDKAKEQNIKDQFNSIKTNIKPT